MDNVNNLLSYKTGQHTVNDVQFDILDFINYVLEVLGTFNPSFDINQVRLSSASYPEGGLLLDFNEIQYTTNLTKSGGLWVEYNQLRYGVSFNTEGVLVDTLLESASNFDEETENILINKLVPESYNLWNKLQVFGEIKINTVSGIMFVDGEYHYSPVMDSMLRSRIGY
jgi:hypothetical protein